MHIGNIAEFAEISTTYAKSTIPLAPSKIDNGCMSWSWDKIFDTELDITLKFDKIDVLNFRRCVGIGRRGGLKILCQRWRAGSTPAPGTK